MAVRDTYMKDYGISEQRGKELEHFCMNATGQEQEIVLRMAQDSYESIAAQLFASLTVGVGYDRQAKCQWLPMQRKDFQGYRRKTLKLIHDFLIMSEDRETRWDEKTM